MLLLSGYQPSDLPASQAAPQELTSQIAPNSQQGHLEWAWCLSVDPVPFSWINTYASSFLSGFCSFLSALVVVAACWPVKTEGGGISGEFQGEWELVEFVRGSVSQQFIALENWIWETPEQEPARWQSSTSHGIHKIEVRLGIIS